MFREYLSLYGALTLNSSYPYRIHIVSISYIDKMRLREEVEMRSSLSEILIKCLAFYETGPLTECQFLELRMLLLLVLWNPTGRPHNWEVVNKKF